MSIYENYFLFLNRFFNKFNLKIENINCKLCYVYLKCIIYNKNVKEDLHFQKKKRFANLDNAKFLYSRNLRG